MRKKQFQMCEPIPIPRCHQLHHCAAQKCSKRRPTPCRSRELRGGILHTVCTCPRRNGLQDDCLRSECQGPQSCLLDSNPPVPVCCPTIYGTRFDNITMGKPSNPIGEHRIRVLNDGSNVVQYDPCLGVESKLCASCGPLI